MKYLVIEIQKSTTGEVANIVTSHNTLNEAESKYHTILASAAISSVPVHSAVILNETGFCVKNQSYTHSTSGGDAQ